MSTAPYVELGFSPTDLRPRDLPHAGAFLGSPADALEAALAVARATMVDEVKSQARGLSEPTSAQLLRIADLAWQASFWQFRKVSGPIIADAYIRAYRNADAGDVPMSVIMELADKHAEKIGDYFHISSRQALAEGFNGMVNRRVPAKAAADRVLDAYGLTPRQMRSYAGASQFSTPVSDVLPRSVKARARSYIDKAFTGRIRKLSRQEEHNIDQQAQQFAWMWLQDKGRLTPKAQKMWITARDERVCSVCGPLHRKKVLVTERFVTAQGEFWTPGLHPNCRCVVRLLENRFSKAWDPEEHPRGGDPENKGRFSALSRTKEKTAPVIAMPSVWESLAEPTEEKISMTEPSDEGKISMTGSKMSMGGMSMKGTVSMVDQISMTGAAEDEKISLTEGKKKIRMSRAEAQEKISLVTTDKMRMAAESTLMHMMSEAEEYEQPKRRTLTRYDRPTLQIQDNEGHEYPVYAVVKPGELNWRRGQVELNHTVQWTPNLSRVIGWADEEFANQIIDRMDRIHNNDDNHMEMTDRADQRWETELLDDEVLEVVNWVAYQGRTADPDSAVHDYEFEIDWRNKRTGEVMEESYRISAVAKMMNIKPSDFDVRIMRMEEGHDSQDGQTVMSHARTKHGYEEWVTSGKYHATPIEPKEVGHNLSLKMFWLDPDVQETEASLGILD